MSAPDTRWLSTEEQRTWRAYLRATRMLEAALDRDLEAHGLQLSEYEILSMLSEQPGCRMRMSALADLVVQSRSRLSHTAARLGRRGWVLREASTKDRRGVELVLTDAGSEELTTTARVHVDSVRRRLIDHLDPAQLGDLGLAMSAVVNGLRRDPDGSDARRGGDVP